MRVGRAPVAAAAGDVIDAAVARQVGTKDVLTLDLAPRWFQRVVGEQFSASIGRTACSQQCGAELSTLPKILRSHEASAPDAAGAFSRFALVVGEAVERIDVDRPALPHQPVLDINTSDATIADPALRKLRIGAKVTADNAAVADQLLQCLQRKQAARIWPASVNAILIELRCVDAIETVDRAVDGKRVGVIRSGRGKRQQHN